MSKFDNMQYYYELDSETTGTRSKLNFQEIVQSNFHFLIDEYNFHLVGANLWLVKYESKDVQVSIYHDRLSYELELYIAAKADEKERYYTLVEIMNLSTDMDFTNYKAWTISEMNEFVPRLAKLIKDYATKAIQGDPDYYKQLAEIRHKISRKLMIDEKEKYINPDVEKALKRKNYKLIAKLYGAYKRYLTREEKSILEFAQEQLRTTINSK